MLGSTFLVHVQYRTVQVSYSSGGGGGGISKSSRSRRRSSRDGRANGEERIFDIGERQPQARVSWTWRVDSEFQPQVRGDPVAPRAP